MTASANSVRAVLVYALVLPMALILGYLLATPMDLGTWAMVSIVLLALSMPLILANHHAVLFLTWNMAAMAFFLPGQPHFWFIMAGLSLFLSLFQRALSKDMRFITAPSIVWPLFFLAVVIVATAKLNGGFGLRIFGSENIGGRRYFMLLASIAGFLAMIAHRVPEGKANRYTGFFFLGSLVNSTSAVLPFLGRNFYFLYLFIPADAAGIQDVGFDASIIRLYGSSVAAMGCFFYLLARHGIRESLSLKHPFRPFLLLFFVLLGSSGGFRTFLILMLLTFVILFYLEGLFRSTYAFSFAAGVILLGSLLIPLANKLPLSIQRALSVLPLNVSPVARWDAQGSSEWRLEMWRVLLPQVPQYLWLGKGLGISRAEIELVAEMTHRGRMSSQELSMLAGDYHNGPLSVIIPFGIWGALGFIWFVFACMRALYLNYKFGDEALKRINRFLLAYFVARLIIFCSVFGSFYVDLALFTGILGLSISLNNGIRKSVKTAIKEATDQVPDIELAGAAAPALMRSN